MEKKRVSVFGTCVTREMFKKSRLEDIFDVELYGKVCMWSLFQESLSIPEKTLKQVPMAEFLLRNIDYELNKCMTEELEKIKSPYLFVDLFSLRDAIYKVCYNDKWVYCQTENFLKNSKQLIKYLSSQNIEIKIERVSILSLDDEIKKGLGLFAEWMRKHYENIVIIEPVIAKKYFTDDGNVIKYSEKTYNDFNNSMSIISKYTQYLYSLVPEAKYIKWPEDITARLIFDDFFRMNEAGHEPNPVHLISSDYERIVTDVLEKLDIDYHDYYTKPLDYVSYDHECLKNRHEKYYYYSELFYTKIFCNINLYTNYLNTLHHHLIIFCVHADAYSKLKYYRNRCTTGLKFDIKFRDSYIGIIDTKNGFRYENASQEAITYTYKIPNTEKEVFVESHGFNAKNFSSIVYDGKEYSKKLRGLNILVVDLDDLSVVDTANCDTCKGEYLLVNSDFLSKFNGK